MADIQKGIDVSIIVNNEVIAGQLNATLSRSAKQISITNKIDDEWDHNLSGVKSWRIDCSGMYVKSSEAYKKLQDAFMSNSPVDVKVIFDDYTYTGVALIIDFPLSATYNSTYKYNVRLLGDGELKLNDTTSD